MFGEKYLLSKDPSNKDNIFRTYKYPDGRVLELTKEELEEIAEAFRMLINQKRKMDGRALLLTPEDIWKMMIQKQAKREPENE